MAIRKDLDDMLNSLMGGGSSEPSKPKAPERSEVQKKSVYDAMSVDDLLNALTEEKKPSMAESVVGALDETREIFPKKTEEPEEPVAARLPELKKKKKIVISGELPDYEAIRRADLEKDRLERLKAEERNSQSQFNKMAAELKRSAEAAEAEIRQRNEKYGVKSEPLAPPVKTEITEEFIINSAPEEPVKAPELPPEPVFKSEPVFEPQPAAAPEESEPSLPELEEEPVPVIVPEPEPIEDEVPVLEKAEPIAPPVPEKKPKKGFFAKLRSKLNADDELSFDEFEEEPVRKPEPVAQPEPEEETVEVDDLFNSEPDVEAAPEEPELIPEPEEELPEEAAEDTAENAAEEDGGEAFEEPREADEYFPEEEPEAIEPPAEVSADELIEAAIAAINNAGLNEEQPSGTETEPEIEPEPEADAELEAEPKADDISEEAPEEETDAVGDLIDGIREDAANAIAELEKPKEERSEEEAPADDEKNEEAEKPADEEKPAEEEESPKKRGKIAAALGEILSEDPDELVSVRSEAEAEAQPEVREKKKFKKRLYAVIGVIMTIFAVIGMITVAGKGFRTFRRFTSGEVKKDGFTEVIYPVVIMDIDSFDSASELSSEQLITAAIWSIIMDEEKVSKYTPNAGGDTISISAYDVEAEAVTLFGEDHQPFEHTTVGKVEPKFFYDSETGAYNVKVKPITFTYEPEIKSIVKSGDDYTVSVDYLDELPAWMDKTVAKSVEFKLTERDDGTYRINSMSIKYVNNSH